MRKATFDLGGGYTFEVKVVGARDSADPGVQVGLSYEPIGFSGHTDGNGKFVDETPKPWQQGMHLQPSYVRAIASALLSAATEAKA